MNRSASFVLAVVTLVSTASMAGAIYKWKDDRGRIHIGDRPPPDNRAAEQVSVRAINTFKGATVSAREDRVSNAGDKVVIYTTRRCAYCKKAKAFLAKHGIPFTEYDVEQSGKGKRDYKRLNGQGVPIIMVGKQRLNGYSEGNLAAALGKAGYTF